MYRLEVVLPVPSFIFPDCKVSEDEFLKFQRRMYYDITGHDMDANQQEVEKLQFRLVDDDDSGFIEYDEFMKNEASKALLKRRRVSNVAYSTVKRPKVNDKV